MSKLERIRALRRQLALADQAEGQQQDVAHLTKLASEIEGPVEALERHAARCRILEVSLPGERAHSVSDKLSGLKVRLTESPGMVGQGSAYRDFKDALVDHVNELRRSADEEWCSLRATARASAPLHLLSFWETVPELEDDAREVRARLNQLQTDKPPSSPEELRASVQACSDILERAERLNSFDAPEAVKSFLNYARSRAGAPFSMLNEEIQSWLEDHELLQGMRIKLED